MIRVFGLSGCDDCQRQIRELRKKNFDVEYVDADADESQDLCDKYDVDQCPHVQVIGGDGSLSFEHIGYIDSGLLQKIVQGLNNS